MPVVETPIVEADALHVNLHGVPILHDVSLQISRQEVVALLGGNGSGKTTLVRSLLGLIPLTSGRASVFGEPVESFRNWSRVGYVPQRTNLKVHAPTVQEIVASGRLAHRRPFMPKRRTDREAIGQALERVGLSGIPRANFARLSGGQQQRVLIARSLATSPDLLVLDEPMAGVDVATQAKLATLLGSLRDEGLTLLVVLHELGELEQMIDRGIVLTDGHVSYAGPLRDGPPVAHQHQSAANPTWVPTETTGARRV